MNSSLDWAPSWARSATAVTTASMFLTRCWSSPISDASRLACVTARVVSINSTAIRSVAMAERHIRCAHTLAYTWLPGTLATTMRGQPSRRRAETSCSTERIANPTRAGPSSPALGLRLCQYPGSTARQLLSQPVDSGLWGYLATRSPSSVLYRPRCAPIPTSRLRNSCAK